MGPVATLQSAERHLKTGGKSPKTGVVGPGAASGRMRCDGTIRAHHTRNVRRPDVGGRRESWRFLPSSPGRASRHPATFPWWLGTLAVLVTATSTRGAQAQSWTSAGNMADARIYHAATLLPNGRCLLPVDEDQSGPLASTELLQPVQRHLVVDRLPGDSPRLLHCDALANGQVLAAGGADMISTQRRNSMTRLWALVGGRLADELQSWTHRNATCQRRGAVASGNNGTGNINSAELYDPTRGSWSLTGSRGRSL